VPIRLVILIFGSGLPTNTAATLAKDFGF